MKKMAKHLLSLSMLVCLVCPSKAQGNTSRLEGKLLDASDQSSLIGASVLMINVRDSAKSRFAVTDGDGRFFIDDLEYAFYKMRISSMGYETYERVLRVSIPEMSLGTLLLEPDLRLLEEVTVEGEVIAVQQIGDTTQYNAVAFKTNPDASASDLVSKMPGIVVDNDGVTANGESVEQVLLDGKRFFGQDPLLSLNTIPAEVVAKVQVYDEQSDQSRFTGFDDGNTTKTMNLVTKKDKRNGQFGKLYTGLGENELYKVGATINSFNGDKRLTLLGMSNNINQQNFGSEDLIGVSGGNGRRGGFRRGGNQNFITGTQDGITRTHSGGLNFINSWGKNTTFEGSYFFNHTNNVNDQVLKRESFLNSGSQFYSENQQTLASNLNHRLNARINHKINDNNNLLMRISISYQNNESDEETNGETANFSGAVLNGTFNHYNSLNRAYNFNNNLIFQHKFSKIGRTVSFDINTRVNPTQRENLYEDLEQDSLIAYFTDETQNTLGSAVTYTEPIGTTAQLSMRFEISHTIRKSDKETFVLDGSNDIRILNESLSNEFKSGYTKKTPSIRYSNNMFGSHFDLSLAYQHATLNNHQILPTTADFNRSFNNLLPSFMGRFEVSESSNLFFRYLTSTTEPSVSQLQNVLDNSDPLFLSLGNPNLDQTYTHSLNVRLQKNVLNKNLVISNFTRIETAIDYISTSTLILTADSLTSGGITLAEGAQLTSPVNVNGYWLLQNNTTFGILVSPIKNNLNVSFGLRYQRLPGMTNDVTNIANTYSTDIKVGLVSNISEKIDYNLYYQINGSSVTNSIQSEANSRYYTQTVGAKLNLIFPKGIVFRNETYFQKYTGANRSFNSNFTLWSMSIAKKFLKSHSAELELSVFDLLGENQSFDQTVSAQYIQETQTQVLQRYFMLTFTYQLRSFR